MEMLEVTDNYAMNTFFTKPDNKLITLRDKKDPEGADDWSPIKSAQLAFAQLCNEHLFH